MGISVERDDDRKRFTAVATSALTLAEILRFMSTHRVGAYRTYALLFDVGTHFQLSSADVRTLGKHVESLTHREGERGRTAVVAADDETFQKLDVYETAARTAGITLRRFRDTASAQQWLESGG
jgi:hypothetical protein